jgi:hypothetical protein
MGHGVSLMALSYLEEGCGPVLRVSEGASGDRGNPAPHLRSGRRGGRPDAYMGPGARDGSRRRGATF